MDNGFRLFKNIHFIAAASIAMAGASLAFAQVEQAQSDVVDDEIVVIGEKLSTWKGKTYVKKGVRKCKSIKSSGDKAIDAIGCEAMLYCMSNLTPQIDQITATAKNKAEAAKLMAPLYAELGNCVAEQRSLGVARLAHARKASK